MVRNCVSSRVIQLSAIFLQATKGTSSRGNQGKMLKSGIGLLLRQAAGKQISVRRKVTKIKRQEYKVLEKRVVQLEAAVKEHEATVTKHEAAVKKHEATIKEHEATVKEHDTRISLLEAGQFVKDLKNYLIRKVFSGRDKPPFKTLKQINDYARNAFVMGDNMVPYKMTMKELQKWEDLKCMIKIDIIQIDDDIQYFVNKRNPIAHPKSDMPLPACADELSSRKAFNTAEKDCLNRLRAVAHICWEP